MKFKEVIPTTVHDEFLALSENGTLYLLVLGEGSDAELFPMKVDQHAPDWETE